MDKLAKSIEVPEVKQANKQAWTMRSSAARANKIVIATNHLLWQGSSSTAIPIQTKKTSHLSVRSPKRAVEGNPVEEQANLCASTYPLPRGSSEDGHWECR